MSKLKVVGTIINKNEGVRAYNTIRYHLDYLGFDKVYFIDNGSTDGSEDFIRSKKDDRIFIVNNFKNIGLQQGYMKTVVTRGALSDGANVIVPFDCDMFWQFNKEDLIKMYDFCYPNYIALKCSNYFFYIDSDDLDSKEGFDYDEEYWRKMLYYCATPNCQKSIILNSTNQFKIFEGDHFVYDCALPEFIAPNIMCFEYTCISHNDLVRKSVNNSIGHIIRTNSADWLSGNDVIGFHTLEKLKKLAEVGHLRDDFYKQFVITEIEKKTMTKNGDKVLYNDRMKQVTMR